MAKILTILIIALILEAVGVVLLSSGLKEVDRNLLKAIEDGKVSTSLIPKTLYSFRLGIADWRVVLGVVFEAVFFGALMYLLSQRDVSVVWPLTSLGLVVTTFSARYYLHEEVPPLRWIGVVLILVGAGLITWTEKKKGTTETPAIASTKPRL